MQPSVDLRVLVFSGALAVFNAWGQGTPSPSTPLADDEAKVAAALERYQSANSPRDAQRAFDELRSQATTSPRAALLCGILATPDGSPVANRAIAKGCLEVAARAGIPEAQYRLAVLLLESAPEDKAQRAAAERLLRSAGTALPESVFLLGLLRADQSADPQAQRALVIEKAAEAGYAPAQFQLAQNLLATSTAESRVAARKWLEAAASQQHPEASVDLALLLESGGRDADVSRIVTLLEQAARAGSARADYALGMRYVKAMGVKRDSERGLELVRRSALKGYEPAQYALGFLLSHGIGGGSDDAAALDWFRRAADKGNSDAMHAVGNAYANGWGVGKSLDMAYNWYCKAAQNGNKDSQILIHRRPSTECVLGEASQSVPSIARSPRPKGSGEPTRGATD